MKLSKNFDSSEFACPCCGKSNIAPELIIKLQQLRDEIGEPIYVTSGVRCAGYNKGIGGYSNSPHIEGLAADIQVSGMTPITLANMARSICYIRLGIYPNHLHVDIVPPHPSHFWLVQKYGGQYIYSKKEKDLAKFLDKEGQKIC